MAKIAIDCDGVLANFTKSFLDEANHIWPGRCDISYQPKDWDDFGDLNKDELKQVWGRIKATYNWWLRLEPYADNMAALHIFFLTQVGHDVWIVTSRVPTLGMTVAKQTSLWMSPWAQEHHNYLGILPVDDWHDKAKIYKAAQIEYSIDDKAETVLACDKLEGHKAYLLDRAWNQHVTPKHRIKTVKAFLEKV